MIRKLIRVLAIALLTTLPLAVFAQSTLNGDVNGDREVNVTDANTVIDIILDGNMATAAADVNADGEVNIADVNAVIGLILNVENEDDWVDLGLPSGTIWATRNVGASRPEDYGSYFAWGETEPKPTYDWDTYRWYKEYYDANDNMHSGFTKYCTSASFGLDGLVDSKRELDPEDDAACAHYPGGRMPASNQMMELYINCSWHWEERNGVYGALVTGPNGNFMFLPAAGYRSNNSLVSAGLDCCYWSRTLLHNHPNYAYHLIIGSEYWYYTGGDYFRDCGFTVRAVHAG